MKSIHLELIKTAAWIIFMIWATGELSPKVIPPQEAKIDYSVRDSTDKVIQKMGSLISELRKSNQLLKTKRQNVPKEVALYSDSDVTAFNDSIVSKYNLK